VILLLLVIVAQLPLTSSCHSALSLGHLVGIVGSGGVSLVLVETLDVGCGVGAHAVVVAHRVVALRAHTGI
jgi:hypothetical protein